MSLQTAVQMVIWVSPSAKRTTRISFSSTSPVIWPWVPMIFTVRLPSQVKAHMVKEAVMPFSNSRFTT